MVLGALFSKLSVWCGAVGYVSSLRDVACLLPMVHGALVYRLLVWCGAVGYVSGLRDAVHIRNARSSRFMTNFENMCLTFGLYLSCSSSSSSSSQTEPEAYTSDAPQPRGLLCNPGSPLI